MSVQSFHQDVYFLSALKNEWFKMTKRKVSKMEGRKRVEEGVGNGRQTSSPFKKKRDRGWQPLIEETIS